MILGRPACSALPRLLLLPRTEKYCARKPSVNSPFTPGTSFIRYRRLRATQDEKLERRDGSVVEPQAP